MNNHRNHNFINDEWREGRGEIFKSFNPTTGEVLAELRESTPADVQDAFAAADRALPDWRDLALEQRLEYLENFRLLLEEHKTEIGELIARETGKPFWESAQEAAAMIAKVSISRQAFEERCGEKSKDIQGQRAVLRFHPRGRVAVLGPFNFPGHLPGGHIIPALLAGNTIVFKPSELTPLVGRKTLELWQKAKLPPGVLNLVQGGRATGEAILDAPLLDGVFFTGSYAAGQAIHRALAGRPEVILALEMGGNNPLLIHEIEDREAAAVLTIESAFITAGQRCSCARRLILPRGEEGDTVLELLIKKIQEIKYGPNTDRPENFFGALISPAAARAALQAWRELLQAGGRELVAMKADPRGESIVSPGLLDVSEMTDRPDREVFAPLLQVIRVNDFQTAIDTANQTAYGLSAGLFSDNPDLYRDFRKQIRAGIINWNRKLTGASSQLPFGGTGHSGNHRPGGYFAADYCSHPSASLEFDKLLMPAVLSPGLKT